MKSVTNRQPGTTPSSTSNTPHLRPPRLHRPLQPHQDPSRPMVDTRPRLHRHRQLAATLRTPPPPRPRRPLDAHHDPRPGRHLDPTRRHHPPPGDHHRPPPSTRRRPNLTRWPVNQRNPTMTPTGSRHRYPHLDYPHLDPSEPQAWVSPLMYATTRHDGANRPPAHPTRPTATRT